MEYVVHSKREPFDVYIGRPSKWGNPFSHKDNTRAMFKVATREQAITAFDNWALLSPDLVADAEIELKDKVLGCWCAPLPCHGEFWALVANPGLLPAGHVRATYWITARRHEEDIDPKGMHPCDHWLCTRCTCKGACSCHWTATERRTPAGEAR